MLRTEKLETVSSVKIKECGSNSKKTTLRSRQKGSILIGIIITMVVMASLGAGMVYLTTTSTFQELFANSQSRAYYTAESGGRYALAVIREAFASADYTTYPPYSSLKTNSQNVNTWYSVGNGKFQVSNISVTGSPKTVDFDVVGLVNEGGFLQGKRKIHYSIQPANQTGGGAVNPTGLTGPINLATAGLVVTTGGAKEIEIPDSGLKVEVDTESGKGKSATLSNANFSYPGDYLMQIKLSAGDANSWIMGLRFNMDVNNEYGYWLTFYNANSGNNESKVAIPDGRSDKPTLLLWQNTPESGYKWIAWADIENTNVMHDGLTQGENKKWHIGENDDQYPTIVVRVQRITTGGVATNVIRAYIGGPTDQGSHPHADNIPNNYSMRRGYTLWTSIANARDHEIKWPPLTGTWGSSDSDTDPYTGDYFTMAAEPSSGSLVEWVLNSDSSVSGSGKTTLTADTATTGTAIQNAVITSQFLTGDSYRWVGLYLDLKTTTEGSFYNWGIEATGGGTSAQSGSGTVIQY